MDKLWAPWRIAYVGKAAQKKASSCIFCTARKNSKKDRVFLVTKHSFAMLNLYPYNNGHALVSPKRHVADMALLTQEETLDLIAALHTTKALLQKTLRPHGYNIGINMGSAGGAGVTGHIHIHIVPRWHGDTNFMPVFHNTKIISQSLDELLKLLKKA
ncbi:MAG TPA: HIT domain-containing protein [Candidatus Omnitrophota bacterium]|nr:HIT domain-containing protein [Candidatus Omnitrophota bacterium]HPT07640.1 HIT domain-containing protein [Candidatus Omnitrophota bacterium]